MATFSVRLHTRDNHSIDFECDETEDVVSAAERQSIILPQQCRNGVCGFCAATTVRGQTTFTDYNEDALTPEQKRNNTVLLCRTWPRSDLELDTDYRYDEVRFAKLAAAEHFIVEKAWLTDRVVHLTLEQAGGDELLSAQVQGGQFTYLFTPQAQIRRSYSLAAPANWDGRLEYLIELVPDGQFSTYLASAKVGERLQVQGPLGQFVLREHGLRPRWFVGGGTGIAPLYSMLASMAEFGEPQPARLFWGLRRATDVYLVESLQRLANALPHFNFEICLSRDAQHPYTPSSVIARLAEAVSEPRASDPDVYICGSDRLVGAAEGILAQAGVASERIFTERF